MVTLTAICSAAKVMTALEGESVNMLLSCGASLAIGTGPAKTLKSTSMVIFSAKLQAVCNMPAISMVLF